MVKNRLIGDVLARNGRDARRFTGSRYVVTRVKLQGKRSAKYLNKYAVYGHKRR